MEIILIILAFLCLLIGLLGAVVPAIPGPPLSFAGLLLLQWSGYGGFSSSFLWMWFAIAAAVTIMDNILPALMTKKFGGSRMAIAGSVIGLIAGIFFFPPVGILVGPFLGALVGELIHSGKNLHALKVALGAFLAFIVGSGVKLVAGSMMMYYAVKAVL